MKREILLSFAGHLLLILAISLVTSRPRPQGLRPQVITVQILPAAGTPQPQPQGPKLVEPAPKPEPRSQPKQPAKPRPAQKPQGKGGQEVIRRQGLGAKVEGAEALGYNYYLTQMLDRIARNWDDPYAGSSRAFRATVMFVIERDGTLTEVKLEKGSGDGAYDAACLRAVLLTEKLPPLPAEFTAPRLKIHLEFER